MLLWFFGASKCRETTKDPGGNRTESCATIETLVADDLLNSKSQQHETVSGKQASRASGLACRFSWGWGGGCTISHSADRRGILHTGWAARRWISSAPQCRVSAEPHTDTFTH